jgi:very-short-patch-repair endonuclease
LDYPDQEIKIDLEIDGKQHKDRKESDTKRDQALANNGYRVYRIEWKSINKSDGREFIKKEIEKFLEFMQGQAKGR